MKSRFFNSGKVIVLAAFAVLSCVSFISCGKSNKTIIRMQHLEEGVSNPTTIEELKDAISKYDERVRDIQIAQGQIGIWYKILAARYIEKEMYGEALKALEKALEYYPDNQNLYYYVGLCAGYMAHKSMDFEAEGRTEKRMNYLKLSEEAYRRAVTIEPRYVRALFGLGVLYVFELNQPENAVPYLEKLLTIDTKHIDAMFVLARAYYENFDFDKAVDLYDKIISITKSPERKAEAEANKKQVLGAAYEG